MYLYAGLKILESGQTKSNSACTIIKRKLVQKIDSATPAEEALSINVEQKHASQGIGKR